MKIFVMRHGETESNRKRLYQGSSDIPLNENGIRQAEFVQAKIGVLAQLSDRIYTSPLQRAVKTCEIVTQAPPDRLIRDDRLREMSFGALEMTPFDVHVHTEGSVFQPLAYRPPEGGERFEDVVARAGAFLEDVKEEPAQQIFVTCHGALMRCMLVYIGEIVLSQVWDQKVENCMIFELAYDGAHFSLVEVHHPLREMP